LGTAIGERPPSPESSAGSSHATPRGDAAPEMQNGDHAEFTSTRMEELIGANAKEFFEPNLYLFDAYPGGIGFSEPLFRVHDLLVQQTRSLILACACAAGCPSCVGPAGDLAPRAKEAALAILDRLCA
jgi:ATP-dependent helicase YprA (DUF1998 family)